MRNTDSRESAGPSTITLRLKPRQYHLSEFTEMVDDIESLIVLLSLKPLPREDDYEYYRLWSQEDYSLWLAPLNGPEVEALDNWLDTLRSNVSNVVTVKSFELYSPVEIVVVVSVLVSSFLMDLLDISVRQGSDIERNNAGWLSVFMDGPRQDVYDRIDPDHPKKRLFSGAARALASIERVAIQPGDDAPRGTN